MILLCPFKCTVLSWVFFEPVVILHSDSRLAEGYAGQNPVEETNP